MYGRAHHAYAIVQAKYMDVVEGTTSTIAKIDEAVNNAHTMLWRTRVELDIGRILCGASSWMAGCGK